MEELKKMKIAQVGPSYSPIYQELFYKTNNLMNQLMHHLKELGHQVKKLSFYQTEGASLDDFDIIHFHMANSHLPFIKPLKATRLLTLHGHFDIPELIALYQKSTRTPITSVSYAQRIALPNIQWAGNIYHGLIENPAASQTSRLKQNYVLYMGGIDKKSKIQEIIKITAQMELPLKIVDDSEAQTNESLERIETFKNTPHVEYLGIVDDLTKQQLLLQAKCLLLLDEFPAPFEFKVIEALAAATPVVALNRGCYPELIDHEISGYIIRSIGDLSQALPKAIELDNSKIRKQFEARFSSKKMAKGYLELYQKVILEKADSQTSLLNKNLVY